MNHRQVQVIDGFDTTAAATKFATTTANARSPIATTPTHKFAATTANALESQVHSSGAWAPLTIAAFFFIFIVSTLQPSLTLADDVIQITGVSRASNYDLSATNLRIYGGIVGDMSGCTSSTTELCDNCSTVAAGTACNPKRIHGNLLLRIDFKVIADVSGYVYFGYNNGSGDVQFTSYSKTSGLLSQDSTGYIEIPWSQICAAANTATAPVDANCDWVVGESGNNLNVFISIESSGPSFPSGSRLSFPIIILGDVGSTNADTLECNVSPSPEAGVCHFLAHPGDEKVYIDIVNIQNSCPTEFRELRVFYSTTSFADATFSSSNYQDLPFVEDSDCEQDSNWMITGLQNDTKYFFRAATKDIANNLMFLTDETYITTQGTCGGGTDAGCDFIATPGNVVGLLPEDFNCFIATAAYGSALAPKVVTFRQFRNRFLLTSEIGREIVKLYYEYGPQGARYIADQPQLRFATRALLFPLWGLAWLSLHYGLVGAFLFIFCVLGFFIYGIREWRAQTTGGWLQPSTPQQPAEQPIRQHRPPAHAVNVRDHDYAKSSKTIYARNNE